MVKLDWLSRAHGLVENHLRIFLCGPVDNVGTRLELPSRGILREAIARAGRACSPMP